MTVSTETTIEYEYGQREALVMYYLGSAEHVQYYERDLRRVEGEANWKELHLLRAGSWLASAKTQLRAMREMFDKLPQVRKQSAETALRHHTLRARELSTWYRVTL